MFQPDGRTVRVRSRRPGRTNLWSRNENMSRQIAMCFCSPFISLSCWSVVQWVWKERLRGRAFRSVSKSDFSGEWKCSSILRRTCTGSNGIHQLRGGCGAWKVHEETLKTASLTQDMEGLQHIIYTCIYTYVYMTLYDYDIDMFFF